MSKIKYNEEALRWEFINANSEVVDYALGEPTDKPWDLTWQTITVTAGGSVDTTATESDILEGETAVVRGRKITGTMTNRGSLLFTPTASGLVADAGYYQSIVVEGDADLVASNIKEGVTIFGVTGTLQISTGTDIKDSTITSGDVMLDRVIGYGPDGTRYEGTIQTVTATLTDNVATVPKGYIAEAQTLTVAVAKAPTVSDNVVTLHKGYITAETDVTIDTATASKSGNVVTIPKGFHQAQTLVVGTAKQAETIVPGDTDVVIPADTYLAGDLTIQAVGESGGDVDLTNLVPENIKTGITINGITGTFTDEGDLPYIHDGTYSEYIRQGIPAYLNGKKYIGTMANKGSTGFFIETVDDAVYYPIYEAGYYEDITFEVKDASKIKAENIKKGVTILDVTGEYEGDVAALTEDADATAADILKDKTAYVNGEKITGTLEVSAGGAKFYECASVSSASNDILVSDFPTETSMGIWDFNGIYYSKDPSGYGKYEETPNAIWVRDTQNSEGRYPCIVAVVSSESGNYFGFDEVEPGYDTTLYPNGYCYDSAPCEFTNIPYDTTDASVVINATLKSDLLDDQFPTLSIYGGGSGSAWSGYEMTWSDGVPGENIIISGTTESAYGVEGNYNGEYILGSDTDDDDNPVRIWTKAFTGSSESARIKYMTGAAYGTIYPAWCILGGDCIWANSTASPDAPIAEICAGPWVKDQAITNSLPTLSPSGTPAGWVKAAEPTEGLSITGYTPEVGKVYNADTTAECVLYPKGNDTAVGTMYYGYIQSSGLSYIRNITMPMITEASETINAADANPVGGIGLGEVPEGTFTVVLVPADSGLRVSKDSGIGGRSQFNADNGGSNGDTVVLGNIEYLVYGEFNLVTGETTIYIEE